MRGQPIGAGEPAGKLDATATVDWNTSKHATTTCSIAATTFDTTPAAAAAATAANSHANSNATSANSTATTAAGTDSDSGFSATHTSADDSRGWQHAGTHDSRRPPADADADTSGLHDATAIHRAPLDAAQPRVPGGTRYFVSATLLVAPSEQSIVANPEPYCKPDEDPAQQCAAPDQPEPAADAGGAAANSAAAASATPAAAATAAPAGSSGTRDAAAAATVVKTS